MNMQTSQQQIGLLRWEGRNKDMSASIAGRRNKPTASSPKNCCLARRPSSKLFEAFGGAARGTQNTASNGEVLYQQLQAQGSEIATESSEAFNGFDDVDNIKSESITQSVSGSTENGTNEEGRAKIQSFAPIRNAVRFFDELPAANALNQRVQTVKSKRRKRFGSPIVLRKNRHKNQKQQPHTPELKRTLLSQSWDLTGKMGHRSHNIDIPFNALDNPTTLNNFNDDKEGSQLLQRTSKLMVKAESWIKSLQHDGDNNSNDPVHFHRDH